MAIHGLICVRKSGCRLNSMGGVRNHQYPSIARTLWNGIAWPKRDSLWVDTTLYPSRTPETHGYCAILNPDESADLGTNLYDPAWEMSFSIDLRCFTPSSQRATDGSVAHST